MSILRDRAMGCLAGGAVGDALGGPTEGWTPDQIAERYDGPVRGIVGPYFDNWREARPLAPFHNGDGRITDDTLMVLALVRVYGKVRDHLDAYAVAEHLVPELRDHISWIPELEVEAPALQRLFLAEKWLVLRLRHAHIDPREAGVGNIVNCGAAMYMAPVGVLNAGNPDAAYAEAIELAGAHQSSYGREAAGVFAAAVAEAMSPGATRARCPSTQPAPRHRRAADCTGHAGPRERRLSRSRARRGELWPRLGFHCQHGWRDQRSAWWGEGSASGLAGGR